MRRLTLAQVLAVDKATRAGTTTLVSELKVATQIPALMNGFEKTYAKVQEDGADYPPEKQKVQFEAEDVLRQIKRSYIDLFDIIAKRDWANCKASANVVVGDTELLADVPVTYLLFLENQLKEIQTFVLKMVELDPASDWKIDPATGLHKSSEEKKQRTQKEQDVFVKYPATPQHPAQTEMIVKDKVVGTWTNYKFSGAISVPRKKEILAKINTLIVAVRLAREQANTSEVEDVRVGQILLNYLFG